MNHLPSKRDAFGYRAASSPPPYCTFPQRIIRTVPEDETESSASQYPPQNPSSTLSVAKNNHDSQPLSMEDFSTHPMHPRPHKPKAWLARQIPMPEGPNAWRRAYRWTMPAHLALHIVSFAASIAIVVLLAQALISHQNLRQIRQFSGVNNAWPKRISLTANIILLCVASTTVVKSAGCLVLELHLKTRPHSNSFLIASTTCSAFLAIVWTAATVFAEVDRQSDENLATWACARSDAAINQIIPYKAICSEEVSQYMHLEHLDVD